jgi:hypothetical protein
MKYPESLLIPIMMFADYFLTVFGAIQREKNYSTHFKVEHYELNPIWQKQIAMKRWFNPRHVVLTIVLSIIVVFSVEHEGVPDVFARALLGGLLVLYGLVLAKHVSNLLIFRRLSARPEEVSGQVVMSHQFVLYISRRQILLALIPVSLVALFSGSPFAWGGVIGIVFLMILHGVWAKVPRKQERLSDSDT